MMKIDFGCPLVGGKGRERKANDYSQKENGRKLSE
jgi:hypothetical protein